MNSNKIEKCIVNMWEQPLGMLLKKDEKYYFQFSEKNRYNPSPLLVPNHPRRVYHFPEASFELPGFIRDYIPGQYGQAVITKYLKRKPTLIEMLLFVGDRGAGALSFIPSDNIAEKMVLDVSQAYLEDKKHFADTYNDGDRRAALVKGSAQDGARPKIFCAYNPLTDKIIVNYSKFEKLDEGYEHILLKFDEFYGGNGSELKTKKSFDQVMEYIYSLVAKELGITMSKTGLINTPESGKWFYTKRFDFNENQEPLHMHSFAGLIHDKSNQHGTSYEELCRTALELGCPHSDLEQIFKLMIFNVVFSNVDDHSRNFSFLMDKNKKWRFAPAYDLTFNGDFGPSVNHLKIFENSEWERALLSDEASTEDYIRFANKFNIKNAKEIIEKTEHFAREVLPAKMKVYGIEEGLDMVQKGLFLPSIYKAFARTKI